MKKLLKKLLTKKNNSVTLKEMRDFENFLKERK